MTPPADALTLAERDPLGFVRAALAPMAAPEDASAEHLRQIAAIAEGLRAHLDDLMVDSRALARRVQRGERSPEIEAEVRWQIAVRERAEQAHRQLKSYLDAAVRARRVDLADLVAGDD